MSLLDLNSGKGSSPRMKRGVKLWIGAGLVAAVVGIGSTLASNITLNSGNTTEFGQGVAQTIFCGGSSADVMVTPISSYVNSETQRGHAAVASVWVNPSWSGTPTFQEVSSSASTNTFTSTYVNDASGTSESVKGYWVPSRSSTTWSTSTSAPTTGYVFVPQAVGTSTTSFSSRTMSTTASGTNKYGYWKYPSWVAGSFTAPVAEVLDSEGPHSFELSGIAITGIPLGAAGIGCEGVDFVVSVYKATGQSKQSMITSCRSSQSDSEALSDEITSFSEGDERRCLVNVKEVAVQWDGTTNSDPAYNIDRTAVMNPSDRSTIRRYVTASTTSTGGIKILFGGSRGTNGTRLDANNVGKIVVETQDDLVAN